MNALVETTPASPSEKSDRSDCDLLDDPALAALVRWQQGELIIGGVLLKRKLGEGGMGAVYLGSHLRLNIPVAVKIMKETSPTNLEMFLREARLSVSIDHPNLVRIFDVNVEPLSGLYYIVMEYIEGCSAFSMLTASLHERGCPLNEIAALKILLPVAQALGQTHRQGIIHCDVKPDNILVRSRDCIVKLTDLGLAGCSDSAMDDQRRTTINGTPGFISPEVLVGESPSPASDVYAIGVTLYELLTGRLPFGLTHDQNYDYKQLNNPPDDPRSHIPSLNCYVAELILKCLSFHPVDRFANGEQLATALQTTLSVLTGKQESTKRVASYSLEGRDDRAPVVLCVDDDPEITEFVGEFLEEHGMHAVCFNDASAALEDISRIRPDAAILDLQMPTMSGLELFQRIRQTPGFENLGALIFSGADNPDLIYTALKQGISDYLIKPIAIDELLDRVKLLCRLRSIQREMDSIESNLQTVKRIRLNESGHHGATKSDRSSRSRKNPNRR